MKVADALKIIDTGWVAKKKGYRVFFQSCTGDDCTADIMPAKEEAPLASDVAAWRSAWKLAQSGGAGDSQPTKARLFNITVIDEEGVPVPYYVTGRYKIYHRRDR